MLLGAYYNLWYGRPTLPIIGGGIWRVGYTYTPFLGEYNSRDEKVISQHIQWAKEAGIDFWAVNWTDQECWDDLTLRDYYLRHPESKEMKFCLLYDSIPALNRYRYHVYPSYNLDEPYTPTKTKGEKFLDDFKYLADTYFKLPNYLKIEGKPLPPLQRPRSFLTTSSFRRSAFWEKKARVSKTPSTLSTGAGSESPRRRSESPGAPWTLHESSPWSANNSAARSPNFRPFNFSSRTWPRACRRRVSSPGPRPRTRTSA